MAIDLQDNDSRPLTAFYTLSGETEITLTWKRSDKRVHVRCDAAWTAQMGNAGTLSPAAVPVDANTWTQVYERDPSGPKAGDLVSSMTVGAADGTTVYVWVQGNGQ